MKIRNTNVKESGAVLNQKLPQPPSTAYKMPFHTFQEGAEKEQPPNLLVRDVIL